MIDPLLAVMVFTVGGFWGSCDEFLTNVAKHYRALSPLRDVRRKLSVLLGAHYDAQWENAPRILSAEELAAAKFMAQHLDEIIRHYDRHKTTMFNLRSIRRMIETDLAQYRKTEQEVRARLSSVPSGKIADLHLEFSRALSAAFLAYTPFIRAEFILRLLWADLAEQIMQIRRDATAKLPEKSAA